MEMAVNLLHVRGDGRLLHWPFLARWCVGLFSGSANEYLEVLIQQDEDGGRLIAWLLFYLGSVACVELRIMPLNGENRLHLYWSEGRLRSTKNAVARFLSRRSRGIARHTVMYTYNFDDAISFQMLIISSTPAWIASRKVSSDRAFHALQDRTTGHAQRLSLRQVKTQVLILLLPMCCSYSFTYKLTPLYSFSLFALVFFSFFFDHPTSHTRDKVFFSSYELILNSEWTEA